MNRTPLGPGAGPGASLLLPLLLLLEGVQPLCCEVLKRTASSPPPAPPLNPQSDFAVHTLPLDIRVAAQVPHRPGWQWPWRRQLPALPQRQQPEERERGNRWWEWPDAGTPAGHP